jgi:hypothetical protein
MQSTNIRKRKMIREGECEPEETIKEDGVTMANRIVVDPIFPYWSTSGGSW